MTETTPNDRRTAPEWLRSALRTIERSTSLDPAVERITPVLETVGAGARGDALRGSWLGHALHPLLTDLPLGCWIGAGLLDVVGGPRSRVAAQRLVGLGLLFVPVTAASGMAELAVVDEQRTRRVGVVHAAGNSMVAMLYLLSWRSRRRDHHLRGVALGLAGGSVAWVTGYLGGHLSFARAVGVGPRGLDDDGATGGPLSASVDTVAADVAELIDVTAAADLLMVRPEQVHAMVAGGLLVPAGGEDGAATFVRAAVLAARSVGG